MHQVTTDARHRDSRDGRVRVVGGGGVRARVLMRIQRSVFLRARARWDGICSRGRRIVAIRWQDLIIHHIVVDDGGDVHHLGELGKTHVLRMQLRAWDRSLELCRLCARGCGSAEQQHNHRAERLPGPLQEFLDGHGEDGLRGGDTGRVRARVQRRHFAQVLLHQLDVLRYELVWVGRRRAARGRPWRRAARTGSANCAARGGKPHRGRGWQRAEQRESAKRRPARRPRASSRLSCSFYHRAPQPILICSVRRPYFPGRRAESGVGVVERERGRVCAFGGR